MLGRKHNSVFLLAFQTALVNSMLAFEGHRLPVGWESCPAGKLGLFFNGRACHIFFGEIWWENPLSGCAVSACSLSTHSFFNTFSVNMGSCTAPTFQVVGDSLARRFCVFLRQPCTPRAGDCTVSGITIAGLKWFVKRLGRYFWTRGTQNWS